MGILGEGDESRHEPPSNLETGHPVTRADVGDDYLGGDEHEAVGDAEEGEEAGCDSDRVSAFALFADTVQKKPSH